MSIPRPTAQQLRGLAGDGGYQRGLDCARRGRVLHTSWDADAETLTAEVLGGGHGPYRCRARFRGGEILSTSCTCPVPRGCKHVVAALLVAPGMLIGEDRARHATRESARVAGRVGQVPGVTGVIVSPPGGPAEIVAGA